MKLRKLAVLMLLLLAGCGDNSQYAQAIACLVDVSGTYADQKGDVVDIIKKGILPGLLPGDNLILIRIDSQSYEEGNVIATLELDNRPSHANAQKLSFAKQLDAFAKEESHAKYTDIRGAMMLATDYLKETGAGTRTIVAFSDMLEDLPKGVRRTMAEKEFEGTRVVAVNVKKLTGDNVDPAVYRERLSRWEDQVMACGASDWRVVVDGSKLVEYIEHRP